MRIGVPSEVKDHEYRVALTPMATEELVRCGHEVIVQQGCARGAGFSERQYREVGARIVDTAAEVFAQSALILKVKEPQEREIGLLRKDQVLFSYLHLAPDRSLTDALMQSGCVAIAYETVRDSKGGLPLLLPMSEIAGRLSVQIAAHWLEKPHGGSGILLGGSPGVLPGKVAIIGGGVVGLNAGRMAVGLGAEVTILDVSQQRLRELDAFFDRRARVLYASRQSVAFYASCADAVIGCVLVPGAQAPWVLRRPTIRNMREGSVIVDVAIDQGGCFETSRPTTHHKPVYVEEKIQHYCVTNIPGAVAATSTIALAQATLPFVLALANKGWKQALRDDSCLRQGLSVWNAHLTCPAVGKAQERRFVSPDEVLMQG